MKTGALCLETVLIHQTDTTTTAIIQRAQAGDKAAFEQLYRDHVGRVFAVCFRLVADRPRAEELTQDTFVHVWHTLHSFKGESRFSSWLHRVAVNVVLMNMRGERRRLARIFTSGRLESFDGASHPSTSGERVDLERAIASLPPRARTIFVLHDVEGYRHEEIAELMGLAVGTTKAQLHRARNLLKEVLNA